MDHLGNTIIKHLDTPTVLHVQRDAQKLTRGIKPLNILLKKSRKECGLHGTDQCWYTPCVYLCWKEINMWIKWTQLSSTNSYRLCIFTPFLRLLAGARKSTHVQKFRSRRVARYPQNVIIAEHISLLIRIIFYSELNSKSYSVWCL